jgi:hypothetical protein
MFALGKIEPPLLPVFLETQLLEVVEGHDFR